MCVCVCGCLSLHTFHDSEDIMFRHSSVVMSWYLKIPSFVFFLMYYQLKITIEVMFFSVSQKTLVTIFLPIISSDAEYVTWLWLLYVYWHCQGLIWNGIVSVCLWRLSVWALAHSSILAAVGLLLWARPAGDWSIIAAVGGECSRQCHVVSVIK